ncbi:MAG: hypothetical protein N2485_00570 [bacterium]|nr:hypothetical protein [bacterium]
MNNIQKKWFFKKYNLFYLFIVLFFLNLFFYIFVSLALENLEALKNDYNSFFIEYQNQSKSNITIANKYLYDYVKIAIYLNKENQAIDFLKQNFLTNISKYNPFFIQSLGDAFFILNDLESSKKSYLTLINNLYNPDIGSISDTSKKMISNTFLKLSNIEYLNGNIPNYFNYLKDSIKFDTNYYSILKKKITLLKDSFIFYQNNYNLDNFNQINQIIEKEIYDLSFNSLKDSNDFRNNILKNDEILFLLADLYYNLYIMTFNDFYKSKALEFINNIKNKNNKEVYYLLINLESDEDKKIEIIKDLISKFDNIDPYFYEQLADYYYKNQDFDNAIYYYLKLVNIIPTKKEALYKISYIYYNKKDFINALNYINLAIKLDDNPDYYYFKGEILLALDNLDEALKNFQLAYDKYLDITSKAKALTKIKDIQNIIKNNKK